MCVCVLVVERASYCTCWLALGDLTLSAFVVCVCVLIIVSYLNIFLSDQASIIEHKIISLSLIFCYDINRRSSMWYM